MFSVTGLCDGPIIRPEESDRDGVLVRSKNLIEEVWAHEGFEPLEYTGCGRKT